MLKIFIILNVKKITNSSNSDLIDTEKVKHILLTLGNTKMSHKKYRNVNPSAVITV